MNNTYTMTGCEGELFLAVNGFVIAYAENFTAKLTEYLKEISFRDQRLPMADHYTAQIILRHLSNPHPDIIRKIATDVSIGKPLDFEFKGNYKSKNGYSYPVRFQRLIPVNGNLDDYLEGYIDEWEFTIAYLSDYMISEFKKAY